MPWTIETISKIVSRTTTPIHVMTDQNSKSASLTNLEEKISFLERHIEEQDREIYNQAEQLQRITQKLTLLQTKIEAMDDGTEMPGNEKPPHY